MFGVAVHTFVSKLTQWTSNANSNNNDSEVQKRARFRFPIDLIDTSDCFAKQRESVMGKAYENVWPIDSLENSCY